ncbi:hypothetical protein [Moorena sp. SIO1G6]|nr:hypothetical protein [Moorena sp. SIO1G6]
MFRVVAKVGIVRPVTHHQKADCIGSQCWDSRSGNETGKMPIPP